jgi:hypothetical protein
MTNNIFNDEIITNRVLLHINNNFVQKRIFLQALDSAILIVGAFFFYKIVGEYKTDIYKLFPVGNKNFQYIYVFLHFLFIFILDLILRYVYAYSFYTPI